MLTSCLLKGVQFAWSSGDFSSGCDVVRCYRCTLLFSRVLRESRTKKREIASLYQSPANNISTIFPQAMSYILLLPDCTFLAEETIILPAPAREAISYDIRKLLDE